MPVVFLIYYYFFRSDMYDKYKIVMEVYEGE